MLQDISNIYMTNSSPNGEITLCFNDTKSVNLKGLQTNNNTKSPWPLVRKRTIPTERLPLVDQI
jgi:hypothetical protein